MTNTTADDRKKKTEKNTFNLLMRMLPILYPRQITVYSSLIIFWAALWEDGLKKSLKLLRFLFLENDKIPITWKISNYINQNHFFF